MYNLCIPLSIPAFKVVNGSTWQQVSDAGVFYKCALLIIFCPLVLNEKERDLEHTKEVSETRDWSKIALWLVTGTMAYNIIEAGVALWTGFVANSNALVGFGFDSVIESLAAGVLLWRLSVEAKGASEEEVEQAEHRVHRFIGLTFFLLAAYVTIDSGMTLFRQDPPAESLVGIILAVVSLIVMPVIAFYKIRAANHLGSEALRSEAKETLACSYLSFTLLLGLSLNALFENMWWSDPAAALLMVPWLVREGLEGFEED